MAAANNKQTQSDLTWRKKSASQLVIKSKLERQIGRMAVPRRGLLFAEYSLASLLPLSEADHVAREQLGLDHCQQVADACVHVAHGGDWNLRALRFQNYEDCTIVLSLGEEHSGLEVRDILVRPAVVAETQGREQPVLKQMADAIWPQLEGQLEANYKPLRFVGHGVAGAVAAIIANRCVMSYIRSEPLEIHSFGAPRWGNPQFHETHRVYHHRWVLAGDLLAELPPAWMGYRHFGDELEIDAWGRRVRPGIGRRVWDQARAWSSSQFGQWGRGNRSGASHELSPNGGLFGISSYVDALYEHVLVSQSGQR